MTYLYVTHTHCTLNNETKISTYSGLVGIGIRVDEGGTKARMRMKRRDDDEDEVRRTLRMRSRMNSEPRDDRPTRRDSLQAVDYYSSSTL